MTIPVTFYLCVAGMAGLGLNEVVAQGMSGAEDTVTRFGALGLCAFMVVQNYRDGRAKDKLLASSNDKVEKLHVETLEVIRKCSK